MFKVGQKVYRNDKVGVIETIDDTDPAFPLGVRFPNGRLGWFTIDGREWTIEPVVLSVVEEPDAFPQDFISELKALLEKYDGVIGTENGQDELYVSGGGKYVRVYKGSMGSDDL